VNDALTGNSGGFSFPASCVYFPHAPVPQVRQATAPEHEAVPPEQRLQYQWDVVEAESFIFHLDDPTAFLNWSKGKYPSLADKVFAAPYSDFPEIDRFLWREWAIIVVGDTTRLLYRLGGEIVIPDIHTKLS
jgi:hypothetical protein